jgi:hypothetical protein
MQLSRTLIDAALTEEASLRVGNEEWLHTAQCQTRLYTKVSGTTRSWYAAAITAHLKEVSISVAGAFMRLGHAGSGSDLVLITYRCSASMSALAWEIKGCTRSAHRSCPIHCQGMLFMLVMQRPPIYLSAGYLSISRCLGEPKLPCGS